MPRSAEVAQRRAAAWRAALSPTSDAARLGQRWRHLGWSEAEALERLGASAGELFPPAPDPAGEALLERGLGRLESGPLGPADAEIPFGEIFAPFASGAELRKILGETAAHALIAELHAAPGYARFVEDLRAGGLRRVFRRYPVLARDLACQLRHAEESAREFSARLEADRPALTKLFPGAEGDVRTIETLGDAHRGGRGVMGVTFAGGRKVIYKPRSLRMDVAWHGLIEWLRARDPACRLRAPIALDHGDYGWVECVAPGSPPDPAEYYRRAGELLALAWLCGGSDFHEENVVATARGPVLVDLETLFTPTARPFGATDEELASVADEQIFGTNVLSTLLLPVWQIDERGEARDLSGFTGSRREGAAWHEPQWVNVGTDDLREEMRPAPGRQPHNIPRDARGRLIPATPFAAEVSAGFVAAARALLAARNELPLESFRGARIRFLVRNTQIYGVMRVRLRQPAFLRSSVDRSIELEKLARPFFPPDPAAPCPEVFNCYEAERRGLENGDIPSFHARNDETTLHGDGGVEVRGYFWKTGWRIAQEKLRRLDEAIIAEQAALVRSSLELRYAASTTPPTDWLGAAIAMADDLAGRAIPLHTGGVSWLSLGFDPVRKMQTAGLMGLDLYSGSLGVAIFLAALARVTGDARWERLARDCTRPRLDQMRETRVRAFLAHMPLGLGSGLGSLIYGCQLLGALLGDEAYLADARFFAGQIPDADPIGDVLGGAAGAVIALLHLGTESAVVRAGELGGRLLASRVAAPTGHRVWRPDFATQPLTGLGHGAAGFALALHRLGAAANEPSFIHAAAEALDYERAVFDAEADNWPDFRRGAGGAGARSFMHGWCAGQPGIGLARLAQFGGDTAETRPEIECALRDALTGTRLDATHLCCGQVARIEFLLGAARARGGGETRTEAERQAGQMLAARRSRGLFPLNGADRGRLFAPSFFQGTTGIGYTFLRLVDETLPSVAMLELP